MYYTRAVRRKPIARVTAWGAIVAMPVLAAPVDPPRIRLDGAASSQSSAGAHPAFETRRGGIAARPAQTPGEAEPSRIELQDSGQSLARDLAASDLRDARLDPATASALQDAIAGLELRRHEYAPEGRPPVPLRVFFKPGAGAQADRVVAAAARALAIFDAWFGPYPYSHLTFVDVSWRSAWVGAAYPGLAAIATRWLARERDVSLERSVIAAVARMYWLDLPPTSEGAPFREGLVLYTGTRGIHEALENRNFAGARLFGGVVPVVVRSVSQSPSPWDPRPRVTRFAEVDEPPVAPWRAASAAPGGEAARVSLALQTLERYIGWPALQQALDAYRGRLAAGDSGATLEAVVSEQRGQSMKWFFDEVRQPGKVFDYAIGSVATVSLAGSAEPGAAGTESGGPARFLTEITLRRRGTAIFAGTGAARDALPGSARSLPVLVRFADGSAEREWLDGRLEEQRFSYTSAAPAALVSVDPDAFLLLDVDRANNTRVMRPRFHRIGARLAITWMVWLQDVMMSCTALL